ncbi:MAG: POT family proton-dependent oligopeptide transporter [Litorivivens sp.]|jgi:POT family proton-dependent oligopeptide transporter
MDIALVALIASWVFCVIWVPLVISVKRKVHPRALFILFFAEMWERFSYYGMRTLLTLYMVKVLFEHLSDAEASTKALIIYGSYTSMVYLFPLIGGIIADKYFGFRKAILFGGVLMSLGHFSLAVMGLIDETNQTLFFLSLALIVVGNGYFKPNISSFLGKFYEGREELKDSAFNIFYMGINVGALLSTMTCGYIGEKISWHLGFGLAGFGMLLGLFVFWKNQKHLEGKGLIPNEENETKPVFLGMSVNKSILIGSIISIPLFAFLMNYSEVLKWTLLAVGLGMFGYLIYLGSKAEEKAAGQKLWVVVVLALFNILFWALFEQAGGSLTLFADKFVNRNVMGTEVPASMLQSFNALFIVILAPVFAWLWKYLGDRKSEPNTPVKFALGLLQLAVGFAIIYWAATTIAEGEKVALVFVAVMYLFHTTGELSLSPIGLSMVTKLSPAKQVGFVMGIWFLSFSLANFVGGLIGGMAAGHVLAEDASFSEQMDVYSGAYLNWGVGVIGVAALLLFALSPILKKWMHGVK